MFEAIRCFNTQRSTRRWCGELLNRKRIFASRVEKLTLSHFQWRIGHWWKQFNFLCRNNRNQGTSQSSRLQSVLNDHVKVGSVTEVDYYSGGNFVIEEQVPWHNHQEIRSRGHSAHDNSYRDDHQHLEAASSQQSIRCGRPRAQGTYGHLPVRNEAAPKPTLYQLVLLREFGNRSQLTFYRKGFWIRRRLQAVRWYHVLTIMPSAEQTQNGDRKVDWCIQSFY